MADSQLVAVAQYLTRGVFSMLTDQVAGRFRQRALRVESDTEPRDPALGIAPAAEGEDDPFAALEPLPSLDDARLGDSLAPGETPPEVPEDLFAVVVGLEYQKRVLRRCITSERPLHALLEGPPGSAKSLLLDELRRCADSHYIVGRQMTAAGLTQKLNGESAPRLLLIDEIEKSDPHVLGTLLTVMTGKLTELKAGRETERDIDVRVIAACNDRSTLDPALLSRFIQLPVTEYSEAERTEVIVGFLRGRQGMEEAQAREVAAMVAPHSADVRDAEQVAELYKQEPELARETASRLHQERPVTPRKQRAIRPKRSAAA